jgi:hypothetical protein
VLRIRIRIDFDDCIRIRIQEGKNDPPKHKKLEEISWFEVQDVLMAEGTPRLFKNVLQDTDLTLKGPKSGFISGNKKE